MAHHHLTLHLGNDISESKKIFSADDRYEMDPIARNEPR